MATAAAAAAAAATPNCAFRSPTAMRCCYCCTK